MMRITINFYFNSRECSVTRCFKTAAFYFKTAVTGMSKKMFTVAGNKLQAGGRGHHTRGKSVKAVCGGSFERPSGSNADNRRMDIG